MTVRVLSSSEIREMIVFSTFEVLCSADIVFSVLDVANCVDAVYFFHGSIVIN